MVLPIYCFTRLSDAADFRDMGSLAVCFKFFHTCKQRVAPFLITQFAIIILRFVDQNQLNVLTKCFLDNNAMSQTNNFMDGSTITKCALCFAL